MILVDANGTVKNIVSATPAVEHRMVFNGVKRRFLEPCHSIDIKPNAVVFMETEVGCVVGNCNVLVGNLKPEVVTSILENLASNGVSDISKLQYQPTKYDAEDYVFDDGKSAAYYLSGYGIFQSPFSGLNYNPYNAVCEAPDNNFPAPVDDEKEDLSRFSDEELRKIIYELKDITMFRLGKMTRDELEQEYDDLEVDTNE